MTKNEFLQKLRKELSGLPTEDIQKSVDYYSEIIDDRIEEGMTEEEAAEAMGDVDRIAAQILSDTPLSKLVKEKVKPKHALRAWEVILIIFGFPVWFPLLIALGAVIFSVYVTLWSIILAIYVTDLALAASTLWGIFAGAALLFMGNSLQGLAAFGIALICMGFAIFMFLGTLSISKGILWLSKKIMYGIKSCFVRKEKV